MSEERQQKAKEDENMAIVMKPNEASIIKKGMLSAFLSELSNSNVTKDYWAECEASRNAFSASDIEKMKQMCKRGNK